MVAETEVIHHVQFTCVSDVASDAVVAVDLAAAAAHLVSAPSSPLSLTFWPFLFF